jgi:hypothetical protein
MKPQRIAMTHQLVLGYDLHKHMDVYVSRLVACFASLCSWLQGRCLLLPKLFAGLLPCDADWEAAAVGVEGQQLALCLSAQKHKQPDEAAAVTQQVSRNNVPPCRLSLCYLLPFLLPYLASISPLCAHAAAPAACTV